MTEGPSKTAVFQAIVERKAATQSEIMDITGLSRSIVSSKLGQLCEDGFLTENGYRDSSGGRKPTLFSPNPEAGFFIGIDVKAPLLRVALLDLRFNIRETREAACDPRAQGEVILDQIVHMTNKLIRSSPEPKRILGASIGLPGLIDYTRSVSVAIERFPAWRDIPIKDVFVNTFGIPVFLENDVALMALGENWHRQDNDGKDFLYVGFRTGIGVATFIDGKLYKGVDGLANMLGHSIVDMRGKPCYCGNRGCLETLASEPAIEERAAALLSPKKKMIARDIYDACRRGDDLARKVIAETGRYLAIGLINLLCLFNPHQIIIGGDIIRAKDVLLEEVHKIIAELVRSPSLRNTSITSAQLGDEAAWIGAAYLAEQRIIGDGYDQGHTLLNRR